MRDELQKLPAIGPSMARDVTQLGVRSVKDRARRDSERMFARLYEISGQRRDPARIGARGANDLAEGGAAQVVELEWSITATEVDPLTFMRANNLPMTWPRVVSGIESMTRPRNPSTTGWQMCSPADPGSGRSSGTESK